MKDNGGQAFPWEFSQQMGMTLRQWYKGMALVAIDLPGAYVEKVAMVAGELADALIAEDREAEK